MFSRLMQRALVRVKLALRLERRFSLEEAYDLLQLAQTILDHARIEQAEFGHPMEHGMVEVPELALQLRQPPERMEEALKLLAGSGCAERFGNGGWRLRLSGKTTAAEGIT